MKPVTDNIIYIAGGKIRADSRIEDFIAGYRLVEYAEADPESAAHTAERQQLADEMIATAKAELEALREKSAEADAAIDELEARIAELESAEDFDYYKAIYDEYMEGRAFVEDLLSGD